jgi:hypothetical protein
MTDTSDQSFEDAFEAARLEAKKLGDIMTPEQIGAAMAALSEQLMALYEVGVTISLMLGTKYHPVCGHDPWLTIAISYEDRRDMRATKAELHRIVEVCGLEDRVMGTDVLRGGNGMDTAYTDIALNLGLSVRAMVNFMEAKGVM